MEAKGEGENYIARTGFLQAREKGAEYSRWNRPGVKVLRLLQLHCTPLRSGYA